MELKINLNLAQAPREINPELNRALTPIYNALRLIQEGFQLTETAFTDNESTVQQLAALISDIDSLGYITLADIPETQQIFLSTLAPSTGDGKDKDLWLATSGVGGTKVYANYLGNWLLLGSLSPQSIDTSDYLAWRGAWALGVKYLKNAVVLASDGSVYLALSSHIASSVNAPPNTGFWKLLQESTVSTGATEAVLSSRAPALPGATPNFVTTSASDLVYARPH